MLRTDKHTLYFESSWKWVGYSWQMLKTRCSFMKSSWILLWLTVCPTSKHSWSSHACIPRGGFWCSLHFCPHFHMFVSRQQGRTASSCPLQSLLIERSASPNNKLLDMYTNLQMECEAGDGGRGECWTESVGRGGGWGVYQWHESEDCWCKAVGSRWEPEDSRWENLKIHVVRP